MLSERKIHSGFVGFLFFVAAALLLIFYAVPAQKDISELKEKTALLAEELQTLTDETGLAISDTVISEVEQKELTQAIPKTLEQGALILDLNRMANAADVSFNALTFSLQQGASVPTVNISAGFQGQAANIVRFLKMIEVNPRKLVVKNAGVSRSENSGGLEFVNLNLTLQAFYQDV